MSQPITIDLSTLCQLVPQPQVLTGLLRELLLQLFRSSASIREPSIRHLIWRGNPQTDILIESVYRWDPRTIGKRPAILIKRNATTRHIVGIDDRHMPAPQTGNAHTTFWMGSHTLFCLATTAAQAELLAAEVQQALTEFGPAIRTASKLHRFLVMEVGPVAEVEEAAEHFVVPVNVAYAYQHSWELFPANAPALKTIALAAITDI